MTGSDATTETRFPNLRKRLPGLPKMILAALAATAIAVGLVLAGIQSQWIPVGIFLRSRDFFSDPLVVKLADAVTRGDVEAIDDLVAKGADVNANGAQGMGLLVWAIGKRSPRGFARPLDHGAHPFRPGRERPASWNPHHPMPFIAQYAVQNRSPDYLRTLLDRGMDPNQLCSNGTPLLFHAIEQRNIPNAALLIDAGADVNRVGLMKDTAIVNAVYKSYYEMALFLLHRGADPTIPNQWHHNALDVISDATLGFTVEQKHWHDKLVEELKARGYL